MLDREQYDGSDADVQGDALDQEEESPETSDSLKPTTVLSRAAKSIRTLQVRIAKATMEAAEKVESLKGLMTEREMKAFLIAHCNISPIDTEFFMGASAKLGIYSDELTAAGLSIQTMKALAVSGPEVVVEALSKVKLGHRIHTREVGAIRRKLKKSSLTAQEKEIRARRTMNRRLAKKHQVYKLDAFEKDVDKFLYEVFCFDYVHFHDEYLDTSSQSYQSEHSRLARVATELLLQFESLFGTDHLTPSISMHLDEPLYRSQSVGPIDDYEWSLAREWCAYARRTREKLELERGIDRTRLAEAYAALWRVSRGRFAHRGGSAMTEFTDHRGCFSMELFDTIAWLSNSYTRSEPIKKTQERHYEPPGLKLVELCAGAGGQAIGLYQAGFTNATLFEQNEHAVSTLRESWSRWKVVHGDISQDIDEKFKAFAGVDLLAGGLPCQPFTTEGEMLGNLDPVDMFPAARRIVAIVKPKAFMFENVEGFMSDRFIPYRSAILDDLASLGYDVHTFKVDCATFGMAQRRKRIVMIGMRDGAMSRFKMPSLDRPWNVGLSEAIGDLVTPHRTPPGVPLEFKSKEQVTYDTWAENWLENNQDKAVPTITSFRKNKNKGDAAEWGGAWLDASKIVDHPPTPGEVDSPNFRPNVTIAMLQRLQGFPDRWRLQGSKAAKAKQLGNAFPPRLSHAIGLAIREALYGDIPDYSKVATPFPELWVGRPYRPFILSKASTDQQNIGLSEDDPLELVCVDGD